MPVAFTTTLRNHRSSWLAAKIVAALIAMTFLTSCTSTPPQDASAPSTTRTSKPTTTAMASDATPMCSSLKRAELQNRVLLQTDLLKTGEFEKAREQASATFKNSVSISGFREIIETGFPFLLQDQPVAFGRCQITGDMATVEVRFGEKPAITVVYFLTQSGNQWWISGATPAEDDLANKIETS